MDEDDEEEELKALTKIPKLHLRPKTAPSVESRMGARYVTWNEAQQQKGPKRPSSGSKLLKHHRDFGSKVRERLLLSITLQIYLYFCGAVAKLLSLTFFT